MCVCVTLFLRQKSLDVWSISKMRKATKNTVFFKSQVNFRTLMSWGFLDDFMVTSKNHWETNKQIWFWTRLSSWKYVFNLMFLYFPLFCSFKSHRSRPCWSLSQVPLGRSKNVTESSFSIQNINVHPTTQSLLSNPLFQLRICPKKIRRNPPFRKLRSPHDKHPGGVRIFEPNDFPRNHGNLR